MTQVDNKGLKHFYYCLPNVL